MKVYSTASETKLHCLSVFAVAFVDVCTVNALGMTVIASLNVIVTGTMTMTMNTNFYSSLHLKFSAADRIASYSPTDVIDCH